MKHQCYENNFFVLSTSVKKPIKPDDAATSAAQITSFFFCPSVSCELCEKSVNRKNKISLTVSLLLCCYPSLCPPLSAVLLIPTHPFFHLLPLLLIPPFMATSYLHPCLIPPHVSPYSAPHRASCVLLLPLSIPTSISSHSSSRLPSPLALSSSLPPSVSLLSSSLHHHCIPSPSHAVFSGECSSLLLRRRISRSLAARL